MHDIFISYSSSDEEQAQALAERLMQEGWTVWWDREIPPGRSFDEVIEEALSASRCVVVLWSKASTKSMWVKTEAAEGRTRSILVPAIIEDTNLPLAFKRIQAANLIGWPENHSQQEFDSFLSAIRVILQKKTMDTDKKPIKTQPITKKTQNPTGPHRNIEKMIEFTYHAWLNDELAHLSPDYRNAAENDGPDDFKSTFIEMWEDNFRAILRVSSFGADEFFVGTGETHLLTNKNIYIFTKNIPTGPIEKIPLVDIAAYEVKQGFWGGSRMVFTLKNGQQRIYKGIKDYARPDYLDPFLT